jgi:hypothetical protein
MHKVTGMDFLVQKEAVLFPELEAMFANSIETLSPMRMPDAYRGQAEFCTIM